MAKAKQNLNLKIQILAVKGTKAFFEMFYKNLTSLKNPHPLPFEKSRASDVEEYVQKRKLLLTFGDLRGFTIVDLNDHAAFEAIWRLSRNETHSLCLLLYIDFICLSPTRNPPAQLKQFSFVLF